MATTVRQSFWGTALFLLTYLLTCLHAGRIQTRFRGALPVLSTWSSRLEYSRRLRKPSCILTVAARRSSSQLRQPMRQCSSWESTKTPTMRVSPFSGRHRMQRYYSSFRINFSYSFVKYITLKHGVLLLTKPTCSGLKERIKIDRTQNKLKCNEMTCVSDVHARRTSYFSSFQFCHFKHTLTVHRQIFTTIICQ